MRWNRHLTAALLAAAAASGLFARDSAALSVPPPAVLSEETSVMGDVNCSGAVDTVDSLQVLRLIAGLSTNAGCMDPAGDTDCDGDTDSVDSLRILRFVAGLSVSAPQGCAAIGEPVVVQAFLLNEVRFLAEGADPQFVEIKNVGDEAASPSGLTLVNDSGGSYLVPDGAGEVPPSGVALITPGAGFLDSASGFVELRAGTVELDYVAWGAEHPASVRLSRGGLIGDLAPGTTVGRIPGSETRGNGDWVIFFPSEATPGAPNPQPGVTMLMPLNGALFFTGDVSLTWYGVPGAEEYRVQVATEDTFAAPMIDETVGEASLDVEGLATGEYSWRVQAIGAGGAETDYSPVHRLTVDLTQISARDTVQAAPNPLDVPLFTQKKDTHMLLVESAHADGDHAWDVPHPTYDPGDRADNGNCALAAIAMVNAWFGGDLSQDRIGFHITEREGATRIEDALYWGHGTSAVDLTRGLEFAIGSALLTERSAILTENWDLVMAAIDSGIPLIGGVGYELWNHAVVIDDYFEREGRQYVHINDPSVPTPYSAEFIFVHFLVFWGPDPEKEIQARSDEPGMWTDSDGDGMVDFDEAERFGTDPANTDTDGDLVPDKEEVRETVFHPRYGHAFGEGLRARYEWDDDGLHKERDCDADNDGLADGPDDDDFSVPPVRGSPVSCRLGGVWTGEAHTVQVFGVGDQAQTRTVDATGIVFAPKATCAPGQLECFEVMAGTVHFTVSGYAAPGCTTEAELTTSVPRGSTSLSIYSNTYVVQEGWFGADIRGTMTCGNETVEVGYLTTQWLTVIQYPWPDHNIIEGEYNQSGEDGSFHSDWRFERIRD